MISLKLPYCISWVVRKICALVMKPPLGVVALLLVVVRSWPRSVEWRQMEPITIHRRVPKLPPCPSPVATNWTSGPGGPGDSAQTSPTSLYRTAFNCFERLAREDSSKANFRFVQCPESNRRSTVVNHHSGKYSLARRLSSCGRMALSASRSISGRRGIV